MTTSGNIIQTAQPLELLRHVLYHQEQQKAAQKQKIAAAIASESPISDNTLEALKFIAPHHANELLNYHLGAKTLRRIVSVKIALETFRVSLQDLLSSLDLFHAASSDAGYFYPINQQKAETLDRKINKEMFSVSCAAKALADHGRALQNIISVPECSSHFIKLKQADQEFIFKLRNNLNHGTWFDANWQIRNDNAGRSTHYNLDKKLLMLSEDWNNESKQFIADANEHIDVRTLFTDYAHRLENFYAWFLPTVEQSLPADVADYQRCCNILKKHQVRQGYSIMFGIFLQQKNLDAYAHLPKYFDEAQLKTILALPNHSAQQVDLIISLLDEHKICDYALRNQIYQLFKVDTVPS